MQDIIDGLTILANANIDWSMTAGAIWWVILPAGFIGAYVVGRLCESACECRLVRRNVK